MRARERSRAFVVAALLAAAALVVVAVISGTGDPHPGRIAPDGPAASEVHAGVPGLPAGTAAGPEEELEDDAARASPERARANPRLPLTIRVLDGRTGDPVPDIVLRLAGARKSDRIARKGDAHVMSRTPFRRGESAKFAVVIELPPGYVGSPFDSTHVGGTPGFRTDSLQAAFVIWPEAPVTVRTKDEDGRPVPGAQVHGVYIAGRDVAVSVLDTGPASELHIEGVPWIPGEKVQVIVTAGEVEKLWGSGEGVLDRDSGLDVEVVVRDDHVEVDNDLPFEESLGMGIGGYDRPPGAEVGALRVVVRDLEGSTMAGARIGIIARNGQHERFTDSAGVGSFEKLPAEETWLHVARPGHLFPIRTPVRIEPGREVRREVREIPGRDLLCRVVDARGAPVPCARLTVSDFGAQPYLSVEDGVQRLNLLTDSYGWIRLPGLPPGATKVRARYGSRTAGIRVDSGSTATIRLR